MPRRAQHSSYHCQRLNRAKREDPCRTSSYGDAKDGRPGAIGVEQAAAIGMTMEEIIEGGKGLCGRVRGARNGESE